MERPLAVGSATGAFTTLVLGLLRNLAFEQSLDSLTVPSGCLDCPSLKVEDLPWAFFGCGLLLGICIGPILDICWLVRERWRRFVWARLLIPPQPTQIPKTPLHRVLG